MKNKQIKQTKKTNMKTNVNEKVKNVYRNLTTMTKKQTIEIQFRKLKGDVIAIFPYEIWNRNDVVSYSHIGQHSAAAWYINDFTTAAKPSEYRELLKEIKLIYNDYNLIIITKRSHTKYLDAYRKWLKKEFEMVKNLWSDEEILELSEIY